MARHEIAVPYMIWFDSKEEAELYACHINNLIQVKGYATIKNYFHRLGIPNDELNYIDHDYMYARIKQATVVPLVYKPGYEVAWELDEEYYANKEEK